MKKYLVIILAIISILSLSFAINLQIRVNHLESITLPPKVNVLSKDISLGDYSISVSKLDIEEVGLNTLVKADLKNTSNQARTYVISTRKADSVQSGYKDITLGSPYIVVPLTNILMVDAGSTKQLVILVSKDASEQYQNTEAWVGVLQFGTDIQTELVLRVLISA